MLKLGVAREMGRSPPSAGCYFPPADGSALVYAYGGLWGSASPPRYALVWTVRVLKEVRAWTPMRERAELVIPTTGLLTSLSFN